MAAPPIVVRLDLDLRTYEQGIEKAKSATSRAAETILSEFKKINQQVVEASAAWAGGGEKLPSLGLDSSKIKEGTKAVEERSDAVKKLISEMQGANNILRAEIDGFGESKAEKEERTALAKAENAAKGRGVSGEERAAVIAQARDKADLEEKKQQILDLQKEVQEFGNSLRDAFKSAVVDGKKLDEVFSGLLKKLANRAIDFAFKGIFEPITNGAGGFFSGLLGAGGGSAGSFIGPVLPGNANGTDNWRGGMTWVGERGPEILNIPRGAQIIPNDILRSGGGGFSAPVKISIDARGADESSIARLQAQLAKMEANLPARIVNTVREANKTRQLS